MGLLFYEILLFVLFIVILLIAYAIRLLRYYNSVYYTQTKTPYIKLICDLGKTGEYLTYRRLKKLKGYKKWLFNCYIPKDDGETTELDVVMLHETGIYVFESKNYSGWIFGTETQKYWTQTLPIGRGRSEKNHFFNPIMQNKGHIKWLRNYLNDQEIPMYSYIIFSDRCTLKNITLTSNTHFVINRYDIFPAVRSMVAISEKHCSDNKIDEIYEKLYRLTQVTDELKTEHIENIRKNHMNVSSAENIYNEKKSVDVVCDSENIVEKECKENLFEVKSMEEKICPRCGARLVLRTASKGEHKGSIFWGCSRFPHCRYMAKELCDLKGDI